MEPRPALHRFQNSVRARNGQMNPKWGALMCRIVGFRHRRSEFHCSLSHTITHGVSGRVDYIVS